MPRKIAGLTLTDAGEEVETIIDVTSFDTPAQELVEKLPTIPEPLFESSLWRDTVPVLKCLKCGSFRNKDQKDEFILHILTHYRDEEEKEAVLNRLLKELN